VSGLPGRRKNPRRPTSGPRGVRDVGRGGIAAASSSLSRPGARTRPEDRAILGLLALAVVVALVRWPASGNRLFPLVAFHAGLLAGFSAYVLGRARSDGSPWSRVVRPLVTVAVIDLLYTSLGKLGVAAMPYLADGALREADRWLLGFDPSLAIRPYQTPGWVEFFGVFYAAFIPYSFLSLALGWTGNPPRERDRFLTGWVFTYGLGYLGYLFVPAHGPLVFQAWQPAEELRGGLFYRSVVIGTELTGGMQGVFPSLHVGGSVYLCLFDLRTDRFRGLTYLPLVALIYVSTVFLRYHYVVDLVAGTAIAFLGWPLAGRVQPAPRGARVGAGLPSVPGGDGEGGPALGVFRELEPLMAGAPMAFFGLANHTLPRMALRGFFRRLRPVADGSPAPGPGPVDATSLLLMTPALAAACWFLPPPCAASYGAALAYSAFYTPLYGDRLRAARLRVASARASGEGRG